jgi:hypothetical protein
VVGGQLRVQEGRNAEPSAGLIDSQSVKGADTVGRDSRGYDAGKTINGWKRFIVADTVGLLLTVVVLSAGMQDRDGAKPVLLQTYLRTPVRFVFADGAFAGRLLGWGDTILATRLHIVRKLADRRGFAVIPRRWAVERTFAWITAHRRLARDYERDPASEAMIPLGRDQHHHPPDRPRHFRDPSTTARLHTCKLIFSNTLSVRGEAFCREAPLVAAYRGGKTRARSPSATTHKCDPHCNDPGYRGDCYTESQCGGIKMRRTTGTATSPT